jgi:uncharacterized protein YggT (Ycf19 family)
VWIVRAISYLVYFYLIVVEIILFLGFFLLLFGANPSAGFTEWVYRNLDRVMAPFRGIFTPIELGTTSSDVPAVFETSVVFAMIVYGIVALALSALIGWLSGRLDQIYDAEAQIERQQEYEQRQRDYQQQLAAGAGQPTGTQPAAAQPTATQPTETQPAATQPGQPAGTGSAPAAPPPGPPPAPPSSTG